MVRSSDAPRLLHYAPRIVANTANFDLPGIERFSNYFKIYGQGVAPNDRTGTVRFPIRTESLFPIPTLKSTTKTFEELCNDRARELLAHADKLGVPLYTFWSGGIDSTLVLVSFLKNATPEQKKNITVLMSEESIAEYPTFYKEYIHGKLQTESSGHFPLLLGGEHVIVNGEHNDQLFGSDIVAKFIAMLGTTPLHQPYSRDTIFSFYNSLVHDDEVTNFYMDMFERVKDAAPVPVETNYLFFWWINFALKWQTVSMRTLTFVSKYMAPRITPEYAVSKYLPFYRTDEFQLWSMNNLDKKIRNEWRTYKWPCKDVIYDFTKDAEYRDNKLKRGSLHFLVVQQKVWPFIDEQFKFSEELDRSTYYEPKNDFI
ncbi:MAG TPA: hypothetical protein VMH91_01380 [Candidatus Paceibacterota bacterium]|nr:hypothetical protein [Candidatus Paceibacterota bacterium]